MRRRRHPRLAACVAAVAVLTACGSSATPAQSRDQVRSGAREVTASLDGTAEVVDATGEWSVCSAGTSDRLQYATRLGLRAHGDRVRLVLAVGKRLGDDGWDVTNAGDTSVNLERDDLRASAKPSRAEPGRVVVEISGGCVDGSRDDVDSLEPQPIDVG